MSVQLIQGIYTIILMVAFIALCIWAFLPRNKKDLDEQAKLVFDDTEHSEKENAHE